MAGRVAYYGGIVKDGLVLNLDAAKRDSYPGSGTTAFDISPLQVNGTLSAAGILSSPSPPHFNQTITVPNVTTTRGLGQNGTVDIWFMTKANRPQNGGFGQTTIIGTFNACFWIYRNDVFATNQYSIITYYNNGTTSTFSTPTAPTIATNTWNNVIYSLNSNGTIVCSVNGNVTQNTVTPFGSWNSWQNPTTTGGGLGAGNMGVANIKMYNRALSAQEVLQNYNATKGRYGL